MYTGVKQTWDESFSMKTKTVCGKTLMNSQKLNGESTAIYFWMICVIMCKSNRSFIPANDYSEFISL